MKALKVLLGLLQWPYLYVYGWTISTVARWAGLQVTPLQGVLYICLVGLFSPFGLFYYAQKTFLQTRPASDRLSADDHEVALKVGWFLMPWFILCAAWTYRWALS